jgi:peptide/nickel transport system ATP-binding protein
MTTSEAAAEREDETVMSVQSLGVTYRAEEGDVQALRNVSLTLGEGKTLGVAGESGSGKSTLGLAIMQYLGGNGVITDGDITFEGRSLVDASEADLRSIRGNRIAHVPQDPKTSLNPSMKIGEQIAETIRLHQDVSGSRARKRTIEILEEVNISDPAYNIDRYPHELSGGMQQRVLIAMALSCNPDLLVLDEPTTGLDVTTQAKILDLIDDLKARFDTSVLLITHDLGVIHEIADRVAILYAGEVMETGSVADIFSDPANPYTRGLLEALPKLHGDRRLSPIEGRIPDLRTIPEGCIFADRCEFVEPECRSGQIAMEAVSESKDHQTRCRRWETVLDGVDDTEGVKSATYEPGDVIIEATDVTKHFGTESFLDRFLGKEPPVQAVNGVDLRIRESEVLGLVGESGCGNSTLGRVLLHLLEPTDGVVSYRGKNIETFGGEEMRAFRSDVQIVFQNPESTLDPRKTVYDAISRPLELFTDKNTRERKERVAQLLEQVGLDAGYASRYPHALSGGEIQRVSIARAFAPNPSFVVLDEPVSALDVSVQASILNLLADLREEYGTSYLLISHDLSVVNHISDRIAVMYLGKIVEHGAVKDVFEPPYHPYTRSLLSSIPRHDREDDSDRLHLEGDVPSPREPPQGCSFHSRCPQKIGDICERDNPALESPEPSADDDHRIACHLDVEEMSEPLDSE